MQIGALFLLKIEQYFLFTIKCCIYYYSIEWTLYYMNYTKVNYFQRSTEIYQKL